MTGQIVNIHFDTDEIYEKELIHEYYDNKLNKLDQIIEEINLSGVNKKQKKLIGKYFQERNKIKEENLYAKSKS